MLPAHGADLKAAVFLEEARSIAGDAGKLLLNSFDLPRKMDFKGEINPVTDADRECEKLIVSRIQEAFPDHGILAEEGTLVESKGPFRWIVDPLDGTTNYAHGLCLFSVSIALYAENRPVLGVIRIPRLNEEFYAVKGEGTFLNDSRVHVSSESSLGRAFLTTGVPYSVRERLDYHIGFYKSFIRNAFAVRRGGSACIDLCYVACGKFDGYWEAGLQPWDAAAGLLMVEEAGGKVSDFEGKEHVLTRSGTLLATNGNIHHDMLKVIQHD